MIFSFILSEIESSVGCGGPQGSGRRKAVLLRTGQTIRGSQLQFWCVIWYLLVVAVHAFVTRRYVNEIFQKEKSSNEITATHY